MLKNSVTPQEIPEKPNEYPVDPRPIEPIYSPTREPEPLQSPEPEPVDTPEPVPGEPTE